MFEDLVIDLADDEDEDEVLDDNERVLQEVQQGVRLGDEESCVEAVTASKSTCEIMFTLPFRSQINSNLHTSWDGFSIKLNKT